MDQVFNLWAKNYGHYCEGCINDSGNFKFYDMGSQFVIVEVFEAILVALDNNIE